jgi:hypothetical protein
MKAVLLIFCLQITLNLFAQNDFVVLKKRGITIDRFYGGSPIKVYTKDDYLFEGWVSKCFHDTIRIHLGYMGLVGKGFGTTIDSVFTGYVDVPVKDITLIPAKRLTAAQIGNFLIKLGIIAGGVIGVNQLNISAPGIYLAQFGAAIVLNFAANLIHPFSNSKPSGYHLGKKFTLVFFDLSNSK